MKAPWALCALLAASLLPAVWIGQVEIFPLTEDTRRALWDFRLPRICFAAVNGGVLATAGLLYQIALRNPMADGFTTGAASSAAFGGCLALALWGHSLLVPLCAIACAALGIELVRRTVERTGGGRISLVLAGMALAVVAGAGINFLKYSFEDSTTTMIFWLMGGLTGATWGRTAGLCLLLGASVLLLWRRRRSLALLFLDDLSAQAAGVDVRRARALLHGLTTVLVAVSVSFCGVIGFLGLMVPHAVRALCGHSLSVQLVCSPLLGATSLVLFDLAARAMLPGGGELPVGVVTSAAGGMFFFLLIARRGGSLWGE